MYDITVSAGPGGSAGYHVCCREDRSGRTLPGWAVNIGTREQAEAIAAEHSRHCASCKDNGGIIRQACLTAQLDTHVMEALLEVAGISTRRRRMKATEFYARVVSLTFCAGIYPDTGELAANGRVRTTGQDRFSFASVVAHLGSLLDFAIAHDRDIVWARR